MTELTDHKDKFKKFTIDLVVSESRAISQITFFTYLSLSGKKTNAA